jgi:hypothetical protein
MGNSIRTYINDSSFYLYKHTYDGKAYPGFKTLLYQVPKTGIYIEVSTKKKDAMIT